MYSHMPIWLFVTTLLIFIAITITFAVVYFKAQNAKKRILNHNEDLPSHKQIKMRWYQNWGPILCFLFAVIGALGIMAICGMYFA